MAEVFAILRAISTSIGVLNLAWQGVKEIKKHGKIMTKFILDVQTIHQLLGLWKQEWDIGGYNDGEKLALIADTSLGLVGLLAPPIPTSKDITNPEAPVSQPTSKKLQKKSGPPPEVVLGRAFLKTQSTQTIEALQEYRNYVKFLDNHSSFGKKLWEVLISRNKDVSEKINSLVAAYHQLETLSDKNFEACYTALSASMPIQARRDAIQEEFDSRYALNFRRYATSIIYAPAFPTEEPDAIGLQLDGQATGTMFSVLDPEVVGYSLIVQPSKGDESFELSIKALGPHRPEAAESEPTSAFLDACRQTQDDHEQSCHIWLQVDGTKESLYYSIRAVP